MSKILKTGEAIQRPGNGAGVRLTTFIPIRIKKRGGRKVIVPPSANAGSASDAQRGPTSHDTPILTAISRAFHRQRLIDEGIVASGVEFARRENLNPSTVNELLRLTLLAPEIVKQILAGRQPRTLSLIRLKDGPMPRDWNEQVAMFRDYDA